MRLNQAAAICASLYSKRMLPILDMTAITLDGETVTLVANNLEIAVRIYVDYSTDKFKCCVDTKKLAFALNAIDRPDFSISDRGLAIKSKSNRFLFPTLPFDDHPGMPSMPDNPTIMDGIFLKELRKVHYAAGKDDARFFLNGINLSSDGSTISAAASNGHRLATIELPLPSDRFSTILPNGAIRMAEKHDFHTVLIGKHIYAINENMEVAITPIDAKYPDFAKAFQHDFTEVRCKKADLMSALRSMSILKDSSQVRLFMEWSAGLMKLGVSDREGTDISAEIACESEPGQYAADLSYITDMVSAADDDASLHYAGPEKPMMVRTSDETHLVMPMR